MYDTNRHAAQVLQQLVTWRTFQEHIDLVIGSA